MNNMNQNYMGGNNYPYQDSVSMYQQRLNNMAQQVTGQGQQNMMNAFPQMQQHPQMANPMAMFASMMPGNQNFTVRVVTGFEEAMASQTPLDGSVSILIDRINDMIYTKQLNMNDGTPLVKRYKASVIPKANEASVDNPVEFVEKKEFDELKSRFDEVWNALTSKNTAEPTSKKESAK